VKLAPAVLACELEMQTRMKNVQQYLYLTLGFLITAAVGYCLQALRDQPPSAQTNGKRVGIEYFMPVQSFSEIENTRALLHALAARSLQELRHRRILAGRPDIAPAAHDPRRDQDIVRLIDDFHLAIREFHGTGLEWLFVQDLLGLLKSERRHEEWITVYLHALYRHPTHELIARFAAEAVRIGETVDREEDVLDAIGLLRGIPEAFASQSPVLPAPPRTAPRRYLVLNEDRTRGARSIE
jgi:hypothetical protein